MIQADSFNKIDFLSLFFQLGIDLMMRIWITLALVSLLQHLSINSLVTFISPETIQLPQLSLPHLGSSVTH